MPDNERLAGRLTEGQFRLDVRRHLGHPRHMDVEDADIDAMRVICERHGVYGPEVAARMLIAMWSAERRERRAGR